MKIKFPPVLATALAKVDAALAGEVYQAIMAYAIEGVEPQGLSQMADALFTLARHLIAKAGESPSRARKKPSPPQETPDVAPAPTVAEAPSDARERVDPEKARAISGLLTGLRDNAARRERAADADAPWRSLFGHAQQTPAPRSVSRLPALE